MRTERVSAAPCTSSLALFCVATPCSAGVAALPHLVLLDHALGGHRWEREPASNGLRTQSHARVCLQALLARRTSAAPTWQHPTKPFTSLAALALWSLANYMNNVWHFFRRALL